MPERINFLFIGSAHIDRLGKCFDEPLPGRSNPGRFIERPGGAALNVASLVNELGATCGLASQIGQDSNGNLVKQCLQQRGIRGLLLSTSENSTATYTAIIGANGHLEIALADMAICDSVDAEALLSMCQNFRSDWLCIDTNYKSPTLHQLLNECDDCKIVGLTVSEAKAPRLMGVLKQLDLLLTNRAEASALTGIPLNAAMGDYQNELIKLGCRSAVITDGDQPITWFQDDTSGTVDVTALDNVVDVIGAGDALAAGVLYALSQSRNLPNAVRFGAQVANSVLGVDGPYLNSFALPSLQETTL